MSKHKKRIKKTAAEPAMVRGVIVAVLTVLASLGFSWAADVDKATLSALVVIAGAVIPIVQAAWTRFAVTANAKVITRVTTDGQVVAGDAAVAPTGAAIPVEAVVAATHIDVREDHVHGAVLDPDGQVAVAPVLVRPELVDAA